MSDEKRHDGRRRYESPRRREQAEATRAQVAAAARRLFLAHGWTGTRVRDVAREAGVAEPTVYAVYGSKVGLARALVDSVDAAAHVAESVDDVRGAGDSPHAQLAAMVATDRRLFERGGDVIALMRDAGQSQPELKDAYDHGRALAHQLHRGVFATWPQRWLRSGVDADYAADTYAALCNIDVYRVFTDERGWSPRYIERWWNDSLTRLLVDYDPDSASNGERR